MKKKREKKSISTENLTDNEGNRSITKKKRRATFNTGTRPTLDESFISWTKIMPLFCCMFTEPVVLL